MPKYFQEDQVNVFVKIAKMSFKSTNQHYIELMVKFRMKMLFKKIRYFVTI